MRQQGVSTWGRYQALCFECRARHLDRLKAVPVLAGNPARPVRQVPDTVAVA